MSQQIYNLKIGVIGAGNVGKSCLLRRLKDNEFNEIMNATMGFEYYNMEFDYNGKKVNAQLWDSTGQKKYMPIVPQIFKGMHGVMLVYDVTRNTSFQELNEYIKLFRSAASDSCVGMMIGNKIDLVVKREISTEKGTRFAEDNGIQLTRFRIYGDIRKDSIQCEECFY